MLLDRDGVLNVDRAASVRSVADLEVVPGAREATARLHAAGFTLVVVTNQACVGRGELTESGLREINAELNERLGGVIAEWLVCPHTPAEGCECRKPRTALLERAQQAWGFDPAATWFVVDDDRDIEAALRFGCRPALVRTGKGARTAASRGDVAVYDDLAAFADALITVAPDDVGRQPAG
ncbi:MAG TPA: HAD-IIIA family hydrolase [Acidimicrobiia bacterium]|nr:HAD-IIIA family hydrolase [Acidimicrobiia bacterium]